MKADNSHIRIQQDNVRNEASNITDKIAQLWGVERDLAPNVVFHDSLDKMYDKLLDDAEENAEFPQQYHTYLPHELEDSGIPNTRKLMDALVRVYFGNVNPAVKRNHTELYRLRQTVLASEIDLISVRDRAKKDLGKLDNERDKDRIVDEYFHINDYVVFVTHYTCLCLNEKLGYNIDFGVDVDEGYQLGNIRDSDPSLSEIQGEKDAFLAGEKALTRIKMTEHVMEFHAKLIAQRYRDHHGESYLKKVVRLGPEQAGQLISLIGNSNEIDSGMRVLENLLQHREN